MFLLKPKQRNITTLSVDKFSTSPSTTDAKSKKLIVLRRYVMCLIGVLQANIAKQMRVDKYIDSVWSYICSTRLIETVFDLQKALR